MHQAAQCRQQSQLVLQSQYLQVIRADQPVQEVQQVLMAPLALEDPVVLLGHYCLHYLVAPKVQEDQVIPVNLLILMDRQIPEVQLVL